MKALLVYPELPHSIWTFPRSIRFVGAKTLLPPLGLLTVAALLPPDWELRLVDLNTRSLGEEDWKWAELVMLSGMLIQRKNLLRLLTEAKRRQKVTVVGGPYATSVPEEVLQSGCDFLVLGEGENTIPKFLEALKEGRTSGIFSHNEKPDMTLSPIPRFDLLDLHDYACVGVQTSRGCPYDCEFCDIVHLYGRKSRYKAPEQVVGELEALYRLGWRGETIICDDNFIGHKARARAILNKLNIWMKSRGEPFTFWTQVSVNLGEDRELMDLMTEANFTFLFVGVETPDTEVLAKSGKFQNIRTPLLESMETMCRNGLSVMPSFVFGLDGEQSGAGRRITDFVNQSGIPMVQLTLLHVLPNTRLWNRLHGEGRLLEERTSGDSVSAEMNYIPSRPTAEVLGEYVEAWKTLFYPPHFFERAYRYHLKMRPTRRALARKKGDPLPDKSVPSAGQPWRREFHSYVSAAGLFWRNGIKAPWRRQFWRQLIGLWRNNPSRLTRYLYTLALGESLMLLTPEIIGSINTYRESISSDERRAVTR